MFSVLFFVLFVQNYLFSVLLMFFFKCSEHHIWAKFLLAVPILSQIFACGADFEPNFCLQRQFWPKFSPTAPILTKNFPCGAYFASIFRLRCHFCPKISPAASILTHIFDCGAILSRMFGCGAARRVLGKSCIGKMSTGNQHKNHFSVVYPSVSTK